MHQPIHAIILSLSLSLSVWHAIFRPHDAERRPQLDKGRPLSESRRSPRQRTCLRTQAHLTTGTLASRSMARFDRIRDQPPRHGASLENHRRDVLCCACSVPATLGLQRCRPEASRQAGRQSLCLSVSLSLFVSLVRAGVRSSASSVSHHAAPLVLAIAADGPINSHWLGRVEQQLTPPKPGRNLPSDTSGCVCARTCV